MKDSEEAHEWLALRDRLEQVRQQTGQRLNAVPDLEQRLAARAAALRARTSSDNANETHRTLVQFSKGLSKFAIDVGDVLEVQPLTTFSPAPGAPQFVRGVVHCRGHLLALLDLNRLLQAGEMGLADILVYLVVESGDKRVALAASRVEAIQAVPASAVSPTPALGGRIPQGWVAGVIGEDRLLLELSEILSSDRLVNWLPA